MNNIYLQKINQLFDRQNIETVSAKLPVSQMVGTILYNGDPRFPNSETCEVKDLGVHAQHLELTLRDKAICQFCPLTFSAGDRCQNALLLRGIDLLMLGGGPLQRNVC